MSVMTFDEPRLTCLYWQWMQLARNLSKLQRTKLTEDQREILRNAMFYANLIHEDLDDIQEVA